MFLEYRLKGNGGGIVLPPYIMKTLITILIFLAITTSAYSDEIKIPFSCWSMDLQTKFAESGKKLDLDPNERTQESWGFVKNEGNKYSILTYRGVTIEELELIKEITQDIELNQRGNYEQNSGQ